MLVQRRRRDCRGPTRSSHAHEARLLRGPGRDGTLVVVRRDGLAYAPAGAAFPTLQAALDDLGARRARAPPHRRTISSAERRLVAPLVAEELAAPLPRAYEWIDGSAYIHHIVLVRKARGAEPPRR